MPNIPGMSNQDYNEMLKRQKRNRQRGKKQRLQKNYTNWFSLAQDLYGDQRMAEELARANPNISRFSRGMTIKTPGQRKDPRISQGFIEGRSWGSLPGAAEGFARQQQAAGAPARTAAGEQPGFAQQRQPTGAYLDQPQQGLAGMERLPLRTDDVYAVLYRSMLPGTAARTDVSDARLRTLGREEPTRALTGLDRAQAARQGSTLLRPGNVDRERLMPGTALPEAARITGPAREYMKIPQDVRRMQASQRVLMPSQPSQEPFSMRGRELEKTRRKPATSQTEDFQPPAYQNSEEIVVQFMREHPEIREGDFSNIDLDQIAMLMNYGYVDIFAGTSAASPEGGGQIMNRLYSGGGGGRGGGGTRYTYGGGGGTRYASRAPTGQPKYIGLVKWRI